MDIKLKKKSSRVIALTCAVALLLTSVIIGISSTLAAKPDEEITFSKPNVFQEVTIGETRSWFIGGVYTAESGNSALASVNTQTKNYLAVTGKKAGVVTVAMSTSAGVAAASNFQIVDNTLMSSYTLKQGGEVYFSQTGLTRVTPVVAVPSNAPIKWQSLDSNVATVDENTGAIEAVGKGAAVIVGRFTDKWGIDRDIHVHVGVETAISDSNLSELIDLINKGKDILGQNPPVYTPDSLDDLEEKLDDAKDVIEQPDAEEADIDQAIQDLKDALDNLVKIASGQVKSVVVTPLLVTVARGQTQQFGAEVTMMDGQKNNDGVTWSVHFGGAGTSISQNGLLTVSPDEKASMVVVVAKSKVDNSTVGYAFVTVSGITVKKVMVIPSSVTVEKGKTHTFAAQVIMSDDSLNNDGVTWSISGGSSSATSINANTGVLMVGNDETANLLTVIATSKKDGTVKGFGTVTVG